MTKLTNCSIIACPKQRRRPPGRKYVARPPARPPYRPPNSRRPTNCSSRNSSLRTPKLAKSTQPDSRREVSARIPQPGQPQIRAKPPKAHGDQEPGMLAASRRAQRAGREAGKAPRGRGCGGTRRGMETEERDGCDGTGVGKGSVGVP
jgi:hypothetical protein